MLMRSQARRGGCAGWKALVLALTLTGGGCLVPADAVEPAPAAEAAAPRAQRHVAGTSLEDRVRILSVALNLDATQKSELRKVLEAQREQVRLLWNDSAAPAAYRVSATRAISDQTADRIRALLNEEQKKKYNPPGRPHDTGTDSAKPGVEDWMNATHP
jgi:hypothetical protein